MASNDPRYKRQLKRLAYALASFCPIGPATATEAADLCLLLRGHDLSTTIGKMSKFGDDPAEIVRDYQLASQALTTTSARGRFYVSIKPPALNFDAELASVIAATALHNGQGVHLDSHAFEEADATLRLLQELLERKIQGNARGDNWHYSLTLPSRWKRSSVDAEWAVQNGVRVRLVKGDFRGAAKDEVAPEQGFLSLVDQLAGRVPELVLATHDCALAQRAIASCHREAAPVQLELVFGMPAGPMMALSRETGVPVGFYVPFGENLLIYGIRDLLTNPHKLLRPGALELLGSQETKAARIIGNLAGHR